MIKSLTLYNFRSHAKTTLEFSPGLNIIAGANCSGKTAIFRAVKWLCENRPSGNSFIKEGEDDVMVQLCNDRRMVSRVKNPNKNTYLIDSQAFHKVGVSVPQEVNRALNLSDINFQHQHDGAYLLSGTPGAISHEINSIFNLDTMENMLKDISRVKRKTSADLKATEEDVKRLKQQIASLKWNRRALRIGEEIEEATEQSNNITDQITKIEQLMQDYYTNEKCMKKYTLLHTQKPVVEEIADKEYDLEKLEKIIQHIGATRTEWDVNSYIIETAVNDIRIATEALPTTCPTCGAVL